MFRPYGSRPATSRRDGEEKQIPSNFVIRFISQKPYHRSGMHMWRFEDPSLTPSKETFSTYSETGQRRRKSHTKSQHGCDFCRRRRIKCNENRPTCGNCSRLRKVCLYRRTSPKQPCTMQDPSVDLALLTPLVQAHISTALACHDGLDADLAGYSPLVNMHAHEWLDHFFRCQRPWLKHPNIQAVMQQNATHQVLANSYLLYAALAVSAAHLVILEPKHTSYKTLSLVLWQKSLQDYSACLLGRLELQDVDALFFAGHLHSMLASVNAHRSVLEQGWQVPAWLLSLRGIKALWDTPSVIDQLRQGIWREWTETCKLEYERVSEQLNASSWRKSGSDITCSLRSLCDSLSPDQRETYEGRIRVLEMLQSSQPSPQTTNLLSWFITRATLEYVHQLEAGDDLALLLLLYWFRLASRLGQWWLSLAATLEFERLHAHLLGACKEGEMWKALRAIRDE